MEAIPNPALAKLGEDIRQQGYAKESRASMKDLVFDLETGEFRTVQHSDIVPHTGDIVTEMTREGFAVGPRRR